MGKLLFHVTGAFNEFEGAMIRERVNASLARAKDAQRNGKFVSKAGIVRSSLGHTPGDGAMIARAARGAGLAVLPFVISLPT